MNTLPGDPNLPPGVTNADIDRQCGDEEDDYCADGCGRLKAKHSNLCKTCLLIERAEQLRDAKRDEPDFY